MFIVIIIKADVQVTSEQVNSDLLSLPYYRGNVIAIRPIVRKCKRMWVAPLEIKARKTSYPVLNSEDAIVLLIFI
jgi:hypothetical protein